MFFSEELLMQTDRKPKLYLVSAAMSYVPAHADQNAPTGWADGDGQQHPVRCITLLRSDGAAKAIPFAMYNDAVNLAPTDAQLSNATWTAGNYTSNYNGGCWNNSVWVPAVAADSGFSRSGIGWTPLVGNIRFIRDETLVMWGWPIKIGDKFTNRIDSAYSVNVDNNGVCRIYYNGTLVKTIRSQDA